MRALARAARVRGRPGLAAAGARAHRRRHQPLPLVAALPGRQLPDREPQRHPRGVRRHDAPMRRGRRRHLRRHARQPHDGARGRHRQRGLDLHEVRLSGHLHPARLPRQPRCGAPRRAVRPLDRGLRQSRRGPHLRAARPRRPADRGRAGAGPPRDVPGRPLRPRRAWLPDRCGQARGRRRGGRDPRSPARQSCPPEQSSSSCRR